MCAITARHQSVASPLHERPAAASNLQSEKWIRATNLYNSQTTHTSLFLPPITTQAQLN